MKNNMGTEELKDNEVISLTKEAHLLSESLDVY